MASTPRHTMKSVLKGDRTGSGSKAEQYSINAYANSDRYEATERERRRQANWLHLIDLKRAGYSPTMTEYVIAPEEGGSRSLPRLSAPSSYCGSPAALCAGN